MHRSAFDFHFENLYINQHGSFITYTIEGLDDSDLREQEVRGSGRNLNAILVISTAFSRLHQEIQFRNDL